MTALLLLLVACKGDKDDTDTPPVSGDDTSTVDDTAPDTDDTAGQTGGDDTSVIPPDDTGTVPLEGCAGVRNAAPLDAEVCVEAAPCRWVGESSSDQLGTALATGADLDGDGRHDLVIGVPYYDPLDGDGSSMNNAGRVQIISGALLDDDLAGLLASYDGAIASDAAGSTVAIAGDLDGDGLPEVLAGSTEVDTDVEDAGAVYLLYGTGAWEDGSLGDVPVFTGESAVSCLGTEMAGAGDINGDGLGDLLIADELWYLDTDDDEEEGDGRLLAWYGQAGRWSGEIAAADADVSLSNPDSEEQAGSALAGGDLDGDGYADVVVGAPWASSGRGHVYVLAGSASGLASAETLAEAGTQLTGDLYNDRFGVEVAVGDVTGDGVADLVVGAPRNDETYDAGGSVYAYMGGASFMDGPTLVQMISGDWDDQYLGATLALGDVTGDGVGDIVMGAETARHGFVTKGGRVAVAPGSTSTSETASTIADAPIAIHGSVMDDQLGGSLGLGDLDGDGRLDLLLGSGAVDAGGTSNAGSVYLFWGE